MPDHTGASLFSTSPHLPHVFYFHLFPPPLLHCLLNPHSSRVRRNGLEEQMFTSCSLWLPGCALFHWSVSHFLVLIVHDIWRLNTLLLFSPEVTKAAYTGIPNMWWGGIFLRFKTVVLWVWLKKKTNNFMDLKNLLIVELSPKIQRLYWLLVAVRNECML